MGTPLLTFVQKNAQQIRDDELRVIKNGLKAQGISDPNVGPNSDYYITATAHGNELAVVQANAVILADQLLPDTAAGAKLDRWLNIFNVARRAAVQSEGVVTITVSVASTLIVTNTQLVDTTGQLYQVTTGGQYGTAPGLSLKVPVQSVAGGQSTNHANGDTLRWVTAPPFCAQTVSVGTSGGTDGLAQGADSEANQDEPPRARLLNRLQNPPRGGNAADIQGWATASSPDVQACFVYPALLGPGTSFFCVVGAAQTTAPLASNSKNRDLPNVLVQNTVVQYVQGQASEHALIVGTAPVNQPTDVALLLALPSAPTASPPGPGGGWLDGTPWPSSAAGTVIPSVVGVTSSTVFQVAIASTAAAPIAGVSHIAYLSPFTWTLYTATVLAVTAGGGGLYTMTIDQPFPDVSVGAFIFPQAVQQANYVAALFGAFAQLGPGEWSSNTGVLLRAFRHPAPVSEKSWPYALDANFLRAMEDAGTEVLTAQFLLGGGAKPVVPTTVTVVNGLLTTTPPAILTPRRIGWFAT